jgi:hypothetical protein
MQLVPKIETSQALPSAWIDRLFQRFALMYGNQWLAKWQGFDIAEVKGAWAADLAFASAEQIRRALDHCKGHNPHPPSCPEFVGLCKQFAPPRSTLQALPNRVKEDIPARVAEEIARFMNRGEKRDPKDWAREILARQEAGTYPSFMGAEMAKRALGLPNTLDAGVALA